MYGCVRMQFIHSNLSDSSSQHVANIPPLDSNERKQTSYKKSQRVSHYRNQYYKHSISYYFIIDQNKILQWLNQLRHSIVILIKKTTIHSYSLINLQQTFMFTSLDKYNKNMMRKLVSRTFCSAKYFLDQKYQNVTLESNSKLGSLQSLSSVFSNEQINLSFIKSHFSNSWTQDKKYCLNISIEKQSPEKLEELKRKFADIGANFHVDKPIKVPWFPRNFKDLDLIGKILLDVKDEVNRDHPQFTDKQYRKRRDYIAKVALQYKMGDKIPDIPYTKEQTDLWRRIYEKLGALHQKGMSKRFLTQLQKIDKQFLISKRIPQLNQLNAYLKNKTGFTIKPTHGILSQREFLNCFAFRVFCCTQYIRHTGTPDYTPQPDIVHQIIGHVPMFADPEVAELSQQIGLLSLGATDEQIAQLGSLYWFTLQFGACLEGDKKLGYGAGIASSISQITHMLSGKPSFQPFDPFVDYKSSYPIQTVQETYRLTESFEKSLTDLESFANQVLKPITTTYNFGTKTVQYDRHIEAIDTGDKPIEFV